MYITALYRTCNTRTKVDSTTFTDYDVFFFKGHQQRNVQTAVAYVK